MKMSLILKQNEAVGGMHFRMNGFAQRLILTQVEENSELGLLATMCVSQI